MQLLLILALSPTIFSTRLRPLFLFWGGLFSLGSAEINQTKILYLVGITLSLVVTILQTQFQLQAKQNRYIPSRYHVVFVIVLLLYFVNFFSAIYSGYAVTDIFRALVQIYIFIVGYYVCLYSAIQSHPKFIQNQIILLGLFASLATFFKWVQLRGDLQFTASRIGLDADLVGLLALMLILNRDTSGTRKRENVLTGIVGFVIVLCFFFTFSRTLIVAIVLIILLALYFSQQSLLKKVGKYTFAFLIFLSLLNFSFRYLSLGSSASLQNRYLRSVQLFASGGLSSQGLGSDQSLRLRDQQGEFAYSLWQEKKLFGFGILPPNITIDNFWGTLASSGIFGVILLSLVFFLLLFAYGNKYSSLISVRIAKQYFLLLILYTFIQNWPTGKGPWFATLLAVTFVVSETSKRIPKQEFVT